MKMPLGASGAYTAEESMGSGSSRGTRKLAGIQFALLD